MQDLIISNKVPFDSIKNKSTALKLIENNLKKTKFKSVAEAEKDIDDMVLSTEKMENENKQLHQLLARATTEQRHQIFQPLFEKSRKERMGY
jgi:16S rRNA G527 N7-methylase RsmG